MSRIVANRKTLGRSNAAASKPVCTPTLLNPPSMERRRLKAPIVYGNFIRCEHWEGWGLGSVLSAEYVDFNFSCERSCFLTRVDRMRAIVEWRGLGGIRRGETGVEAGAGVGRGGVGCRPVPSGASDTRTRPQGCTAWWRGV